MHIKTISLFTYQISKIKKLIFIINNVEEKRYAHHCGLNYK